MPVEAEAKLTACFATSDGRIFDNEDEARAYCATAEVAYAELSSSEAVVEDRPLGGGRDQGRGECVRGDGVVDGHPTRARRPRRRG